MPRAWSTAAMFVVRLVECYNPARGLSLPAEYYGLTSISDGRVQEAGSTLGLSRGALYPPILLLLLLSRRI